MEQLIQSFPNQLSEALNIGLSTTINPHPFAIHNVVLCGMGGSGIGGAYVRDMIKETCLCPYIINNDYGVPAYVNKHTLVIVSSYSGNTEETVNALEQALQKSAKIVCISSGGKVKSIAEKNNLDYIQLPGGYSSPRACLGFSIVAQLYTLFHLNLINSEAISNVKSSIDLLKFEQDDMKVKAEKLATTILGKTPVIYTIESSKSVAERWRQQINENSKILGWHHTIPEMNHNELVGWRQKKEDISVIFLRYKDESKQNILRIDLTKNIVTPLAGQVIEIYAKGRTRIEKMIYLTHLGDWLSYYLAQVQGIDAEEIKNINYLKSELEKNSI
jgi:glucose/mannose-6-phosphate isomerase